MNSWINVPIKLTGQLVDLVSLDRTYFSDLAILALDRRIWEHYAYDASIPEKFQNILNEALVDQDRGSLAAFVILLKPENKVIGSTRLMDIQQKHRKLEIGTTWLHPDYWGTAVNLECKLLLLTYCFETLETLRVQLKTDENNIRSRKAIEKIGGEFEGILRNDMLRENGTHRNSAYYSLIAQEWTEKKAALKKRLEGKVNSK